MNKIFYLLIFTCGLVLFTQNSFSQKDSSGIYKTAEDFQQRKLSYAINCKTEKHKINPNVLFKGSGVKVKHQGNTYNLKKSEVFGYRACDGKEYRFADNKEYKVLNPGEPLILYFYQHPAHTGKEVNNGMYRPQYFFSINAASPLQDLTKANIKAVYRDNHKYHDALDENFKEDKDLYAYDSFHKMYKVAWILKNYKN